MRNFEYTFDTCVVQVMVGEPDRTGRYHGTVTVLSSDKTSIWLAPRQVSIFDLPAWGPIVSEAAKLNGRDADGWTSLFEDVRIQLWAGLQPPASPSGAISTVPEEWGPVQPLPEPTPVPPLPPDLLPEPFKYWTKEIAERACFPVEYVAVPAMIAEATVVGRKIGIKPWPYDDFTVVANLWGAIVGASGVMKSYAIDQGTRPLRNLAAKARDRFQAEQSLSEAYVIQINAEIEGIERAIKDAVRDTASKDKKLAESAREDLERLKKEYSDAKSKLSSDAPTERRYLTQDVTVEKLGMLLRENPNGMLVVRDELAGWLRTINKPGREGDREFYLEAWNGTEPYTFDRVGRGTLYIPATCVSICGGIQPSKFAPYLDEAIGDDSSGADGMLQRFQLVVWPDSYGEWSMPDSWPDKQYRDMAYEAFSQLDELNPSAFPLDTEDDIPCVRYSVDAQSIANTWRVELENRLRGGQLSSTPAFQSHMAKYRSLMPSLSLLIHLAESVGAPRPGPVSERAVTMAIEWCQFLEAHARKIYADELNPGIDSALALAEKLRAGRIVDGQTVRDIYRPQWEGLKDQKEVMPGLLILSALNWLRIVSVPPGPQGGRPTEIVRLNPNLTFEK